MTTWAEMAVEDKVWTVPAERMEAKRAHRAPLSERAIGILREVQALEDESGLVFPSPTGKPLSNMTLSKLLKDLKIPAVQHRFRSSFRDWVRECTHAPRAVMEAALSRSDLFERRRGLMEQWATIEPPYGGQEADER